MIYGLYLASLTLGLNSSGFNFEIGSNCFQKFPHSQTAQSFYTRFFKRNMLIIAINSSHFGVFAG